MRSKAPVTSPLTNGFPATGGLVLSHVPLKQQSEQESSQAPHTGMLPGAPQCMTCEAPPFVQTHTKSSRTSGPSAWDLLTGSLNEVKGSRLSGRLSPLRFQQTRKTLLFMQNAGGAKMPHVCPGHWGWRVTVFTGRAGDMLTKQHNTVTVF